MGTGAACLGKSMLVGAAKGALIGAISGAMNPKFCFAIGTLVMTKQGLKAIEEIQVGEQVLAYNDNLEMFEYKDVVEVYKNEATQLCHIHTDKEEIVCTPNHSILTNDGWKQACELTSKDLIKTSTRFVEVVSIEIEQLKEKTTVYNLNVLGYHTYVVGNDLLVVHNSCKPKKPKKVGDDQLMKGHAHAIKTDTLKDPSLGNIDKNISHYNLYQDTADNGRLWMNKNDDKSIWIDTFEYFNDHAKR